MTEEPRICVTNALEVLLLLHAGGDGKARKTRLLAAQCCRHVGSAVEDELFRQAVETIERYSDGLETKEALERVREAIREARQELHMPLVAYSLAEVAAEDKGYIRTASEMMRFTGRLVTDEDMLIAVFRDIFGSLPRCPHLPIDPQVLTWNNGTVKGLAEAAYEERLLPSGHLDGNRLAVLADALEEAGCQETELLGHLRSEQVHVRGCWAVDRLLGKD
jgi:hypothetical protein